jgi:hypothetical protein
VFSLRYNQTFMSFPGKVIIGGLLVLAVTGCQKELHFEGADPVDQEVWVLKTKSIQGFATNAGHVAYTTHAAFYYDTAARTLTYRDTSDNAATSEYKYFYDSEGRLIRTVNDLATGSAEYDIEIQYNSDSLMSKVIYNDYLGVHEGNLQWSRQDTNYVAQYSDPAISAPFTDGKRTYVLNSKKQLIEYTNYSIDPSIGNNILRATLDDKGAALFTRSYYQLGNTFVLQDSVTYTREDAYPARLSKFNALWSRGIEWFCNYYFISFLVPPVWDTEYFVYFNSMPKKRSHYAPVADQNGNLILAFDYDDEYITEYDANKNPVKHTIFMKGEKVEEVSFTWQKINWIH